MSYSVQDSKTLMNDLVQEYLDKWIVYHPDPSKDNYVTGKQQEEMITYIMKNMVLDMTDTIKDQLSIAYKVSTDEELLNSIKEVAKIAVLGYTLKQNSITNSNIPNINLFNS